MPFRINSVNRYHESYNVICVCTHSLSPSSCSLFHNSQWPLHLSKKLTDQPNKAKIVDSGTEGESASKKEDKLPVQSIACRTLTDPEKFCCAEHFLSELQPIQNFSNLPEGTECPICLKDYGTSTDGGPGELRVRLPHCGHLYGLECLTRWISPECGNKTCGYCRRAIIRKHSQYLQVQSETLVAGSKLTSQILILLRNRRCRTRQKTLPGETEPVVYSRSLGAFEIFIQGGAG